MKKQITCAIGMLSLLLLCSCDYYNKVFYKMNDLKGHVKSCSTKYYDAKSAKGEINPDSVLYIETIEFNPDGNVTLEKGYSVVYSTVYKFNEYEWDADGKYVKGDVKRAQQEADNNMHIYFHFNEKGQITLSELKGEYDSDQQLFVKYEYTADGYVSKREESYWEGASKTEYEYGDNGLIVGATALNQFDYEIEHKLKCKYHYIDYDDNGNWVKRVVETNDTEIETPIGDETPSRTQTTTHFNVETREMIYY